MSNYLQRKISEKAAKAIPSKDLFLEPLKAVWPMYLPKGGIDIDRELALAKARIRKERMGPIFESVGVTDEDLRKVLESIVKERGASEQEKG